MFLLFRCSRTAGVSLHPSVREFAWQARLSQWNTIDILQVSTLEEALTRVQELPAIY